jgi:serine/threonine-protein kinase
VSRALEIDPDLGEAHTSLAFLHMYYDWDWFSARREFEHALELHPNYATGHQWYAELLSAAGESEHAIAEAHRAHELDPLEPILGTTLGDAYFFARRYDEAEMWLRRTLEVDPGFIHAINDLGRVMSETGRYDEALTTFDEARAVSGGNPLASVGRAYTLARAGRHDEARQTLAYLETESMRRYVSPHAIAAVLIGLGEHDAAIEWLERAYREHDRALVWMNVHPRLDPLRGNPRFDAIAKRVMAAQPG